MRAVIVMPRCTPGVKVERTRGFGAEVILHGDTLDQARAHAVVLGQAQNLCFVHPFDDEAIVAGQGTVALEMLAEVPNLDCLVVAIGGGGLISGMATVAKALRPNMEVLGVQTMRFPAMLRVGRLARIRVSARDVPGSLARITAIVAEAGANIDEVHHQRAFTTLAAQNVEIEVLVQTRGHAHVEQVLGILNEAGFDAKLV